MLLRNLLENKKPPWALIWQRLPIGKGEITPSNRYKFMRSCFQKLLCPHFCLYHHWVVSFLVHGRKRLWKKQRVLKHFLLHHLRKINLYGMSLPETTHFLVRHGRLIVLLCQTSWLKWKKTMKTYSNIACILISLFLLFLFYL